MININIIKDFVDWLQAKSDTKFGLIFIGFLIGFSIPFSFMYSNDKYIKEVENKNKELRNQISDLDIKVKYWENKAFESENNYLEKMKNMMYFFDEMEKKYNDKLSKQKKFEEKYNPNN